MGCFYFGMQRRILGKLSRLVEDKNPLIKESSENSQPSIRNRKYRPVINVQA